MVWLVMCAGVAVFLLALFFWGMAKECLARRNGGQPWPGLRAANGLAGSGGIFFAILAVVQVPWVCSELSGPWRWIGFVTANLLVQPLSVLFLVAGCYQIGQALRGRATYAFRVIPREGMSNKEYRELLSHRVVTGLATVGFAIGLGSVCLRPLF